MAHFEPNCNINAKDQHFLTEFKHALPHVKLAYFEKEAFVRKDSNRIRNQMSIK